MRASEGLSRDIRALPGGECSRTAPTGPSGGNGQIRAAECHPTDPDLALLAVADRQRGLVTQNQLLAVGFSRKAVAHRVRRGRLREVHRHVYALGHLPLTRDARHLAAVLACGADALLSHRAAATAWGMVPGRGGAPIDVTVIDRNCRSQPGIHVHRVTHLHPIDRRRRDGIPLTSAERALIDLAATATARELEKAFDEGKSKGVISARAMDEALERYPHRRGCTLLRPLTDPGRKSTLSRSGNEDAFLALIRRARLPAPEMNARMGIYTVDFLWHEHKVAVEIDSHTFHSSPFAFQRDRQKTLYLQQLGYIVLRFTDVQLRTEPELVLAHTATALARASTGEVRSGMRP